MVGQTIRHYRIVEKIGQGGMGVVYRAHDERLNRQVAIKVLLTRLLSDDAVRRRFHREAMSLAKVNHPNIATIHEFDADSGVDFLVMEFVAGSTLEKCIDDGALSETDTIHIGLQVLRALGAAHELGIIHRDLKPSNIMIGPKQHVKVLDFGLAKSISDLNLASTESFEGLQDIAGTLPYMAPEVLKGRSSDVRTDIWAYGVLLYEASTGHKPFQGRTTFELTSAILGTDPASLPSHLSPRFRSVVSRCLLKDPQRRYQTVGEIEAAFDSAESSVPVQSSATRWLTILIVALLAVSILAFFLIRNRGSATQKLPASKQLAILPMTSVADTTYLTLR